MRSVVLACLLVCAAASPGARQVANPVLITSADVFVSKTLIGAWQGLTNAFSTLDSARNMAMDIELGRTFPAPTRFSNYTKIADAIDAGRRQLESEPFPAKFDAAKYTVRLDDLRDPAHRPAAFSRLRDYLAELERADRGTRLELAFLDDHLREIDAAREAARELTALAAKLSGVPQFGAIFLWSWADLELYVNKALGDYDSAVKTRRRRLLDDAAGLPVYIANLKNNLALLEASLGPEAQTSAGCLTCFDARRQADEALAAFATLVQPYRLAALRAQWLEGTLSGTQGKLELQSWPIYERIVAIAKLEKSEDAAISAERGKLKQAQSEHDKWFSDRLQGIDRSAVAAAQAAVSAAEAQVRNIEQQIAGAEAEYQRWLKCRWSSIAAERTCSYDDSTRNSNAASRRAFDLENRTLPPARQNLNTQRGLLQSAQQGVSAAEAQLRNGTENVTRLAALKTLAAELAVRERESTERLATARADAAAKDKADKAKIDAAYDAGVGKTPSELSELVARLRQDVGSNATEFLQQIAQMERRVPHEFREAVIRFANTRWEDAASFPNLSEIVTAAKRAAAFFAQAKPMP